MPNYEVRITGGDVMMGGQLVSADLLIREGKITAAVGRGEPAEAVADIDATGKVVLPGIVDLHAHTREPGYTQKEDFLTASMAGAVGGITTMVDMPNVEPPTDTVETFEEKRALADAKSIIDWGHWVAGTNRDEVAKLAVAGATGYKIFQVSGAYPHDPRLAINDDGQLLTTFRTIAETGLPCIVHPFNQSLFEQLSEEAFASGKPPNEWTFGEVYTTDAIWHTAVNTLINIQRLSGVRLHVVHTHSAGSLRLIRAAKAAGQRVTASLDPKYYHLTPADLRKQKGRACPGGFITEDADRMREIWASLNDGTIDFIDADHAPHTLEEIAQLETDAWHAAMGSPQYDWQYSVTLTDVAQGKLSLARAVELLAASPARFLGAYPRKGALLPGSDADLVVVDLKRQTTLTDDGLFTKVGWTPFLGWTLTGYVELTMLRGTVIARDREVVGEPGYGEVYPRGGAVTDTLTIPSGVTALGRQGRQITLGVMVPHFGAHASRRRVIAGSALVEQLGFDAVWVRDHLLWTPHGHEGHDITFIEPLAALAAIAAVTDRIYLGTAVLIPLRWPLKLAQDLAALSYLSDGRVVAGLGTGHKHDELAAAGFDAEQRREIVDETVHIMRRIWSEDTVSHDGPLFPFTAVRIEPKPVRPLPLWYGGTTRAAIRRVVTHFDGWLPGGIPLNTLDDRIRYLQERCIEAGRDLPTIGLIPRLSVSKDRRQAREAIDIQAITTASEGTKWWLPPPSGEYKTIEDLRGIAIVGEPEEVAGQIIELAEHGIDHLVFDLRGQFDRYEENLELLASETMPLVHAELAGTT